MTPSTKFYPLKELVHCKNVYRFSTFPLCVIKLQLSIKIAFIRFFNWFAICWWNNCYLIQSRISVKLQSTSFCFKFWQVVSSEVNEIVKECQWKDRDCRDLSLWERLYTRVGQCWELHVPDRLVTLTSHKMRFVFGTQFLFAKFFFTNM